MNLDPGPSYCKDFFDRSIALIEALHFDRSIDRRF